MNKSILLLTAFSPMAFPALGQEKPDPPKTSIGTAASRDSVSLIETAHRGRHGH